MARKKRAARPRKSARKKTPARWRRPSRTSLVKRRRHFSSIDRLPDRIRETVRQMYLDPAVDYQDIADYVLIQTSPASARATITKALNSFREQAKAAAGGEWRQPYEASRAEFHKSLLGRGDVKRSKSKPVLLSDSAISRDYRATALLAGELEELARMHAQAFERFGADSGTAIARTTNHLLQLKISRMVDEAKSPGDFKELKGVLHAGAQYYRAASEEEKARARGDRAVKEAMHKLQAAVRQDLEEQPELLDQLTEVVRRNAEALA